MAWMLDNGVVVSQLDMACLSNLGDWPLLVRGLVELKLDEVVSIPGVISLYQVTDTTTR